MEMERHLMMMYTSCGWFFDEISGIETMQVLRYSARALQLAEGLFAEPLEEGFKARLSKARSNLTDVGDGAALYEQLVKPAMTNLTESGSSLWHRFAHRGIRRIFRRILLYRCARGLPGAAGRCDKARRRKGQGRIAGHERGRGRRLFGAAPRRPCDRRGRQGLARHRRVPVHESRK